MKTAVVSYSFSGNNDALASSIASAIMATHIRVTEPKKRTMGMIMWDVLFNRTPKVNPPAQQLDAYDFLILSGPVWMGLAPSPMRAYLSHIKGRSTPFAFVSISGGASGANPKLAADLKKRTGREPLAVIDMAIADLLPEDPKPTREMTMAYRLTKADIKQLTESIVQSLQPILASEFSWTS
jgi:hypothetical protein